MAQSVSRKGGGSASTGWLGVSVAALEYKSQAVAYPYFAVGALLFLLQIVFGLIIAAQFVWPTFLMTTLPFNVGREAHLNLLVFWLLLGLMGATYYLVAEEARSEIYSTTLAYVQLAILVLAGLGTMVSFIALKQSWGKPFTESPSPWPWLIAAGAVIFLINVGLTIIRSRRWTAISLIIFGGMAGLSVLYLLNLRFVPNLTVDWYWWWWIIHLWVEGTWELVAAGVMAYLLLKVTGVDRAILQKWLYVEVGLTLFTGIIGLGHHYYWIGTPAYWLLLGAVFSALEPVPIALMAYDALRYMRQGRVEPANRVAWYWLGGTAIGHFAGAGVWGFAQTLPQINQWTHGTQVTAAHGHFAFFGAYVMLVLAAIYYMVPQLRGLGAIRESRGMWAFWLMVVGMMFMVLAFSAAGIVQTYLYRLLGMDFMTVRTQFVSFWIFWVWISGLVLFTPGLLVYVWDFFAMRPAAEVAAAAWAGQTGVRP